MNKIKIQEIELYETEFKTKQKFEKLGFFRLKNTIVNIKEQTALDAIIYICERIDANATEVLDAINRTVR